MGIYPASAQWGGTLTVTGQISNKSYGNAPATRAAVVLTPDGTAPGGPSDVIIGSIDVPAITAWSTVNVEKTFYLPVTPPTLLGSGGQYTLSIRPDADYLTNPIYPHIPTGGVGVDQVSVSITVPPGTTPPALGLLSDLAATSVTTSSALYWGQGFQVQAGVQNLGDADPGPFRVRFVLVAASGDTSHGLFLGDTIVPDLKPGESRSITQDPDAPVAIARGRDHQQSDDGEDRCHHRSREPAQRDLQEQQHRDLRTDHLAAPGDRRNQPGAEPAGPRTALAGERPRRDNRDGHSHARAGRSQAALPQATAAQE